MSSMVGAIGQENIVPAFSECMKNLTHSNNILVNLSLLNNSHIHYAKNCDEIESSTIALAQFSLKNTENHYQPFNNPELALSFIGLIHNYDMNRGHLMEENILLSTHFDYELLSQLLSLEIKKNKDILTAITGLLLTIEGTFCFSLYSILTPNQLFAVNKGCTLIIGMNDNTHYCASDLKALAPIIEEYLYLEDGDVAILEAKTLIIYDKNQDIVQRERYKLNKNNNDWLKSKYPHVIAKQLFEEPDQIIDMLQDRISSQHLLPEAFGQKAADYFSNAHRIQVVASASGLNACLVGKYWLEEMAGVPCQVETIQEYHARHKVAEPNKLFVCLIQTGEEEEAATVLNHARQYGYAALLVICPMSASHLGAVSDLQFLFGDSENNNFFQSSLIAILLLALALGRYHRLDAPTEISLIKKIIKIPKILKDILSLNTEIKNLAKDILENYQIMILGLGLELPVALNGALHMAKFCSIKVEAYPLAELQRTQLSLIDFNMPIIVLATNEELMKLQKSMQDILDQGRELIVLTDKHHSQELIKGMRLLILPTMDKFIAPIIFTLPIALLTYNIAILKGINVDKI